MNISEIKKSDLYKAISDPIMDERIAMQRRDDSKKSEVIDYKLFLLEIKIWEKVTRVLNISDS